MAIWQYQLFFVPEEEIGSSFSKTDSIRIQDFDGIDWWKYRQLEISQFDMFESILPRQKSWSDNVIIFGDEANDCVVLLKEKNKIIEISARIDLRNNFDVFLNYLCNTASENNCVFLNDNLKILYPSYKTIKYDIENYDRYKSFLDKLKE
ncbi:hypothetical protein D3C87_228130 [compost metagenome]